MDSTVENPTQKVMHTYGTSRFRWLIPLFLSLFLILDDQGIISGVIGLFLLFFYLPLSFRQRYQHCRRERLTRFTIYLLAFLLGYGMRVYNTSLAQERAERIIAAVEAYRAQNGVYPEKLQQLVPRFIPKVPEKARMALTDSGFRYISMKLNDESVMNDRHMLMYVTFPPFGRRTYSFETASWGRID